MVSGPSTLYTTRNESKRPTGRLPGSPSGTDETGQKGINTMMKRNKKSTGKSTGKSLKSNISYVKLPEFKGTVQIEDGEMWLKSGKYDAPSVSVKIDPDETVSDWMRKITLRNVVLTVEENDKGYPELVISGHNDEDDEDDAGDDDDLPF